MTLQLWVGAALVLDFQAAVMILWTCEKPTNYLIFMRTGVPPIVCLFSSAFRGFLEVFTFWKLGEAWNTTRRPGTNSQQPIWWQQFWIQLVSMSSFHVEICSCELSNDIGWISFLRPCWRVFPTLCWTLSKDLYSKEVTESQPPAKSDNNCCAQCSYSSIHYQW